MQNNDRKANLSSKSRASVFLLTTLLVILGCTLGAIGAEMFAQIYAYYVVKKGKLFQPDERLGWIPLPNLHLVRLNADGQPWVIETNANSIRGPAQWPQRRDIRRVLILGDSFAFGEGVDLADRFDMHVVKQVPCLAVVNIGVMGYGTDQEIIRARRYINELRRGDIVLILFYGNDFMDLARTSQSARPKPWFELTEDRLIEHLPQIGLLDELRDKSYIISVLAAFLQNDRKYAKRLSRSNDLILQILKRFVRRLGHRGVDIWFIYHGLEKVDLPFDALAVIERVCDVVQHCIDLDPLLNSHPKAFLSDGHWNAQGHALVGQRIARMLSGRGNARGICPVYNRLPGS